MSIKKNSILALLVELGGVQVYVRQKCTLVTSALLPVV
jgi:hypothetical protein